MKKSILNLGAQELTKNEQKSVKGGLTKTHVDCINSGCVFQANSPGPGWVKSCGHSLIWCFLD